MSVGTNRKIRMNKRLHLLKDSIFETIILILLAYPLSFFISYDWFNFLFGFTIIINAFIIFLFALLHKNKNSYIALINQTFIIIGISFIIPIIFVLPDPSVIFTNGLVTSLVVTLVLLFTVKTVRLLYFSKVL